MRFHRLFAAVAVTFLAAGISRADEKLNTLTAKEAADGWVLLFDGETAFGWGPSAGMPTADMLDPAPTVTDGALIFTGKKMGNLHAYPTVGLGDYELTFEARRGGK